MGFQPCRLLSSIYKQCLLSSAVFSHYLASCSATTQWGNGEHQQERPLRGWSRKPCLMPVQGARAARQAPIPAKGGGRGGRSRVLCCEACCSGNGFWFWPYLSNVSMRMSSLNVQLRERSWESGRRASFTFQSCCLHPTLCKIQLGKGKRVH